MNRFTISLLGLIICTGCSSTALLSQRGSYLRAYHEGSLEIAEQDLTTLVQKEIPDQCYTASNNASWILLDRATTRFAMGKVDEAVQDYAAAMESLDYYKQDAPTEQVMQVMLQDETGSYQADDFEQVLARIYFALALIHQGDESNAYALLRSSEDYQQEKRALYARIPFTRHYHIADNGLGKYLFAVLLEKRGDLTNAKILYDQAQELIPCSDATGSFVCKKKGQATVLVLCHNGNAPYKISSTSPAAVASGAALEFLLATHHNDPALSTMMGIPVPALRQWPYSMPIPTYAAVDDAKKPLVPFYNINEAAAEQLEQKTPVIVARGVARLAMRRCAVGYADRRDPRLGLLTDLAMCAINYNTRADTRSWTTLPGFIDLTRFNLDAGQHTLTIQVYDKVFGSREQCFKLSLESNDLCIIHVFNIHPGISRILIPNRYLIAQEK